MGEADVATKESYDASSSRLAHDALIITSPRPPLFLPN